MKASPSPASRITRFAADRLGLLRAGGTGARSRLLLVVAGTALALLLLASTAGAAPLTEFGHSGTGAGEFESPTGIGVDQQTHDVFIADRNNSRIEKFDSEGHFLLAFGWGVRNGAAEAQTCGPQASPPTTACRVGLEGPAAGQLAFPEGLAVDNDPTSASHGDLYTVDLFNHRIDKFGPAGEFLLDFGSEGSGPGQFEGLEGQSVAVGPEGSVFVGDENRVQRFSPAGALEAQIPLPGAGRIGKLAVDSAGDIYLQGGEQAGIHKYDPTGTELGRPRDSAGDPKALVIGPGNEIVVEDGQSEINHHLLIYDAAGVLRSRFDPVGAGGERAISIDESLHRVYLITNTRVRVLALPAPGPYVAPGSESAAAVTTTTATLLATLNPEGGEKTTYHFEYDTTPYTEGGGPHGLSTPTSAPFEAVNEVQTLTVVASGGGFTVSYEGEASAEIPFNADAAEVQAALEAIPAIGTGNVTVTGPAGGPWAIEFSGALAGTDVAELSPDPTNLTGPEPSATLETTTTAVSAFSDLQASAELAGLSPRTTYHFRLVASNKAGETTAGPDQSFETLPPVSIDGTTASQVSDSSAQLEANLDPHGLATTYHFEYDTSPYAEGEPAHGTLTPQGQAGSGQGSTPVSALIVGLAPATTYHFRVVASNALGAVDGPDRILTTQGSNPLSLPDGRAWEMVSPPQKNGISLQTLAEGPIRSSLDGRRFAYLARGSIGSEPPGNRSFLFSQLSATRGPTGWTTSDISVPHEAPSGVTAGESSEYLMFSEDLSQAAVAPEGITPLSPQATERTVYLRRPDGEYVPLVTPDNVPPGTKIGGHVFLTTGTPDLSRMVVESDHALTPGFESHEFNSVYEWDEGSLTLLGQIPASGEGSCGGLGPECVPAAELGINSNLGLNGLRVRQALSNDGERAIFQTVNPGKSPPLRHLWLRDQATEETLQLDAPAPGAPAYGTVGSFGEPLFQLASADDSRIFFTDVARLTPDATARDTSLPPKPDLYECEVGVHEGHLACTLTDLSVDNNPGESADVLGAVIGADANAEYVYFVANGRLVNTKNPLGESPVADEPNLYLSHNGVTSFLATLSGRDEPDWRSLVGIVASTDQVSPNGRWVTFMSQRSLTGYDNRATGSGEPAQEVFLYHAGISPGESSLICASCNPTGARPHALHVPEDVPYPLVDGQHVWAQEWLAGSVPAWTRRGLTSSLFQSRFLDNNGRLFFDAADSLVPQDNNGTEDVYEYEPAQVGNCLPASPGYANATGGCVALISSGTGGEESAFLDASESGDDVFFLTSSRLAPQDTDGSLDVYDAHVCTAELPCPTPPAPGQPECDGDACQPPATPPNDPTPGSLTFKGAGNELNCPKRKVKKNGKCVAKKSKKSKHKKPRKKNAKKSAKRAGSNRGGAK